MPADRHFQAPREVVLRSFLRAAASFGTRPGNAATDRFVTDSSSAAVNPKLWQGSCFSATPAVYQRLRWTQMTFAFSIKRFTRHALVLASLRQASISTRSPSLYSLFSSCAWYFCERVTTLP